MLSHGSVLIKVRGHGPLPLSNPPLYIKRSRSQPCAAAVDQCRDGSRHALAGFMYQHASWWSCSGAGGVKCVLFQGRLSSAVVPRLVQASGRAGKRTSGSTPPMLLGDGAPGAMQARSSVSRVEHGRSADEHLKQCRSHWSAMLFYQKQNTEDMLGGTTVTSPFSELIRYIHVSQPDID